MGKRVNMTWWRRNTSTVLRLLLLVAIWIPEVAVTYLAWNIPLWYVGGILAIIFLIVYGVIAGLLTLAIT